MPQFFTFVVPSDSGGGKIHVRGNFDRGWGFRSAQGPAEKARYGDLGIGFREEKPDQEFVVHFHEPKTNHRFTLKWMDTNNNNASIKTEGGIRYVGAESIDNEMIG